MRLACGAYAADVGKRRPYLVTCPPASRHRRRSAGSGAAAHDARLTVLSTPSRAGVTVNGRWRGRTPLTLDTLPFGTYNVRVVQPGFAASNEDVMLTARQPMRTAVRSPAAGQRSRARRRRQPPARRVARPTDARRRRARLRSPTYAGTIYVDSRPRGATVLIDGKPMGTTPASIPDIPIGSHVVRLELADHRAWTTSTRVAAGEQARVTGSLERIR